MSLNVEIDSIAVDCIKNISKEFAIKCIKAVSEEYDLNFEEVLQFLQFENTSVKQTNPLETKSLIAKSLETKPSVTKDKASEDNSSEFPIPYAHSLINLNGCHGLLYNYGLFTQCHRTPTNNIGENKYCKNCLRDAENNEGLTPKCGTIHDRKKCSLFQFQDPKGRKPTSYLKVLEKLNIDKDVALKRLQEYNNNELIEQFNYKEPPKNTKRGRPRKEAKEINVNNSWACDKDQTCDKTVDKSCNDKETTNPCEKLKPERKKVVIEDEAYFIGQAKYELNNVYNSEGELIGKYDPINGEMEIYEDDGEECEDQYI
jgi:hypothetical protein